MKCSQCDKEATFDSPDNLCTIHWSEWWADCLLEGGTCKDRTDPLWIYSYNEMIQLSIDEGEIGLQLLPIDEVALEKRMKEIKLAYARIQGMRSQ